MAFADVFHLAYTIKFDLRIMKSKQIELSMMTESLSLSDVLKKSTMTTETKLMIGLQTIKKSYRKLKLNAVSLIRSEFILADSLTKIKAGHLLSKVLSIIKIDYPVEQSIIRNRITDGSVTNSGSVLKLRAVIVTHLQ